MPNFTITSDKTRINLSPGGATEIVFTATNLAEAPVDTVAGVEWVSGPGTADWIGVVTGTEVSFGPNESKEIMVRFEAPNDPPKDALNADLQFRLVLKTSDGAEEKAESTTARIEKSQDWKRIAWLAAAVVLGLIVVVIAYWPTGEILVKKGSLKLITQQNRAISVSKANAVSLIPVASCEGRCDWTVFQPQGKEEILLQGASGAYLMANEDGVVGLLSDTGAPGTRWFRLDNPNKTVSLKSLISAGRLLFVSDGRVSATGTGSNPGAQFAQKPYPTKNYVLVLESFPEATQSNVVKMVMKLTELDAADAKRLVANLPQTLHTDAPVEELERLVHDLSRQRVRMRLMEAPRLPEGPYRIKVKRTNKYLHEDGRGDKLVSTRAQDRDDYSLFLVEQENDGIYRIKVKGSGRYWHEDGNGDKLVSTRYQSDDDFTRFYLELQADRSYRIRVKANNHYLHLTTRDQLVSSRAPIYDDLSRFFFQREQ